jgi:hypothetical protein
MVLFFVESWSSWWNLTNSIFFLFFTFLFVCSTAHHSAQVLLYYYRNFLASLNSLTRRTFQCVLLYLHFTLEYVYTLPQRRISNVKALSDKEEVVHNEHKNINDSVFPSFKRWLYYIRMFILKPYIQNK